MQSKRCWALQHVPRMRDATAEYQHGVVQAESAAAAQSLENQLGAAHSRLSTLQTQAEAAEARCVDLDASLALALAGRTAMAAVCTSMKRVLCWLTTEQHESHAVAAVATKYQQERR